mgnify:CR=1 FL=1
MTFLAALLVVTAATPPPPPPLAELSTPRFVIRYTQQAEGMARVLSRDVESMRDDVASLLGRDWPGVTEIRLGTGREQYEALALPGGPPPEWAIALAYPGRNVVLLEANSLLGPDGRKTLKHELVHVALGQFATGWPRWFQEGLAMELTGERQWRMEQFATMTTAVTSGRLYDFRQLEAGFPASAHGAEVAYAQSAAFVEFLRQRNGRGAFLRLIDRMAQGDNFEKAFGVAFYVPISIEEAAFFRELPRRYPWWTVLLSSSALWAAMSVLLVVGYFRRRREVRALRARQAALEVKYELSKALLLRPVMNDDAELDGLAGGATNPLPQRPWLVTSVTEK